MSAFDIEVYNKSRPYKWAAFHGTQQIPFKTGQAQTRFGLFLSVWLFTLIERRRS